MNDKAMLTLAGIICMTLIECAALVRGLDGQLLLAVVVAISAAIGVPVGLLAHEKLREVQQ